MAEVPSTFAEWLKSAAMVTVSSDAAVKSAWGELAVESESLTPFALESDAQAEGARQISFLGQAFAVDTIRADGALQPLVGQSRRVACDRAGYASAPSIFIIAATEEVGGTTLLTVLRRMTGGI